MGGGELALLSMTEEHPSRESSPGRDATDLAGFGYRQRLDRTLGGFSSFAAGFSYLSILTGLPQLFYLGFGCGRSGLLLDLADGLARPVPGRALLRGAGGGIPALGRGLPVGQAGRAGARSAGWRAGSTWRARRSRWPRWPWRSRGSCPGSPRGSSRWRRLEPGRRGEERRAPGRLAGRREHSDQRAGRSPALEDQQRRGLRRDGRGGHSDRAAGRQGQARVRGGPGDSGRGAKACRWVISGRSWPRRWCLRS